jgi:predicted anti-sigma-YlaC factor YlaD
MECKDVKEKIPAWIDGELDGPAAASVAGHVEACPSCREEARRLEAAWALLDRVTVPGTPPGLVEKIVGAPRFSWRGLARWPISALAAAAVVAGLLGGYMLASAYTGLEGGTAPRAVETVGIDDEEAAAFDELPPGSVGRVFADLVEEQAALEGSEEESP